MLEKSTYQFSVQKSMQTTPIGQVIFEIDVLAFFDKQRSNFGGARTLFVKRLGVDDAEQTVFSSVNDQRRNANSSDLFNIDELIESSRFLTFRTQHAHSRHETALQNDAADRSVGRRHQMQRSGRSQRRPHGHHLKNENFSYFQQKIKLPVATALSIPSSKIRRLDRWRCRVGVRSTGRRFVCIRDNPNTTRPLRVVEPKTPSSRRSSRCPFRCCANTKASTVD